MCTVMWPDPCVSLTHAHLGRTPVCHDGMRPVESVQALAPLTFLPCLEPLPVFWYARQQGGRSGECPHTRRSRCNVQ